MTIDTVKICISFLSICCVFYNKIDDWKVIVFIIANLAFLLIGI